ncbi:hypothetical protein DICSQDRAFT_174693 [Dichomitus squalens LYAD-421 SS1]|nr:uncharacterized protein DICSQDRAFT_174693 [Dichomitus squalens LYAD-421 SS1]EJF56650.1 hypothetical protein DICSQDRAFT_174693 [Dichomitus squalens LYAD-421 SS1]
MGRSAKFYKRTDKKKTSSAGSAPRSAVQSAPKPKTAVSAPTPKEQKKRTGLKEKAKAHKSKREGDIPVLGGADYVELMLGGRRKAAAEAAKLPKDPDS